MEIMLNVPSGASQNCKVPLQHWDPVQRFYENNLYKILIYNRLIGLWMSCKISRHITFFNPLCKGQLGLQA